MNWPSLPAVASPDPAPDANDDDGGIPQPVWRGRMPEVTAEERDDQPCCLWLLGPPEGDDRKARPGTDYPDRTSLGPWDRGVPNERLEDGRRIPDVAVTEGDSPVYIDITVPFDDPANLYRAAADKEEKYGHLGTVLPLVVGALGSWFPENDNIRTKLDIPRRLWDEAKRKMRQSTIEDSCRPANDFLNL